MTERRKHHWWRNHPRYLVKNGTKLAAALPFIKSGACLKIPSYFPFTSQQHVGNLSKTTLVKTTARFVDQTDAKVNFCYSFTMYWQQCSTPWVLICISCSSLIVIYFGASIYFYNLTNFFCGRKECSRLEVMKSWTFHDCAVLYRLWYKNTCQACKRKRCTGPILASTFEEI